MPECAAVLEKYENPIPLTSLNVEPSMTFREKTGCGNLFVTIVCDPTNGGLPNNIIGNLGKSGGCASAWVESICSMIQLALGKGATLKEISDKLMGVRCHQPVEGKNYSCIDALAQALVEDRRGANEQA